MPSKLRSLLLLIVLTVFAGLQTSVLIAQDASPSTPATTTTTDGSGTASTPTTKDVSFWDILKNGGPVMYPLGVAWVLVFYFLYDGIATFRANKMAPPAVIARIKETFSAGNYQEAWSICQANKSFLTNILSSGLERVGRGKEAVDFAIEESAVREGTILKVNITYLSVIGVVSPMIGLTGTVIGMIKAFRTLGSSGIANPSELASSIGEVLVATATGLVVAIPAFIFYYILKARAQTSILVAESKIYRLIDDIPYEQLSGIRIGEDFSAAPTAPRRESRTSAQVSQKVSRLLTTSCPACNAPITVGKSPCGNCGTVLDWGS